MWRKSAPWRIGSIELEAEREPLFRAPWPVVSLVAVIVAAFAMQSHFGVEQEGSALGFAPADLGQGRLAPLVMSLFVHGGWAHALTNSAFIMAFGAPVSRRLGQDALGAIAFIGFFLICGVLANLGYAAVHPASADVVVGASGAAAGLMAATSRLMTRESTLAPFFSRPVLSMAGVWIVLNLLLGLAQSAGIGGLAPGAGGAPVAWEVHLFGYAAGLFLFAPLLSLIRRA